MGRPKGSKNKPKAAPPKVKAKAKRKTPARVSKPDTPPDWLRKAMAVQTPTKPKVGRKPNAVKEKFQATKAKRGRKPMANKPGYDPMDDPDFRAGTKGDAPIIDPPKPGIGDNLKPGIDNTLPGGGSTKPVDPRPGQKPALPGGGVHPDNVPPEPEAAPLFDEVQSGAVIPDENIQTLIAGTLGGSGDNHASAKRIVERMKEAKWVTTKALDEGIGDTRKGKDAKSKDDDAKRKA